jgi:hypothetical protein
MAGTVKEVLGTAQSVGCTVEGMHPHEVIDEINSGEREVEVSVRKYPKAAASFHLDLHKSTTILQICCGVPAVGACVPVVAALASLPSKPQRYGSGLANCVFS